MMTPTLSDLDRDQVAASLRRVDEFARDLRREYPEAFETESAARDHDALPAGPGRPAPTVAQPS